MSRLRRPYLYNHYLFVTVDLLESRARFQGRDYERLVLSITRMRQKHGFLLTAWVFMPDHWHAVIYLPSPLTISQVFQAVKVSSMVAINHGRREAGELWQGRSFDQVLRTVQEYWETVNYIHWNPVRRALVKAPEDWKWSSVHEYAGVGAEEQERRCGLRIDRVTLPVDENARI
jgi:putative transposase